MVFVWSSKNLATSNGYVSRCDKVVEQGTEERWPLIKGSFVSDSSLWRSVFAFRDEKFNDIHTKREMIWRSVWSGGVGSANEHFFRAIPAAGVILLARERNKRKRKPGKVMEMLRQISSPSTFLFRSGRILSLLRCDEPWKTLVLSSSRARDTSSTRLLLAFYFILVPRVL